MPRPPRSAPTRTKGTRSAEATERGPQTRGERTRRRLLDAAEKLFAEHGYADTSLDAIAEAAEMHQPGIFYYFPDKWTLYEAVCEDVVQAVERKATAALASGRSPEECLLAAASAFVDQMASRPTTANLLLREAANPDASTMPAVVGECGARLGVLIREQVRAIAPDVHPDDLFHFNSSISGTALFYATAFERLAGPAEQGKEHSIDRHKRLLMKTIRLLLNEIRKGG